MGPLAACLSNTVISFARVLFSAPVNVDDIVVVVLSCDGSEGFNRMSAGRLYTYTLGDQDCLTCLEDLLDLNDLVRRHSSWLLHNTTGRITASELGGLAGLGGEGCGAVGIHRGW